MLKVKENDEEYIHRNKLELQKQINEREREREGGGGIARNGLGAFLRPAFDQA